MQLLKDWFYTENQINLLLSIYPIMFGLISIILVSSYKTSTLQFIYCFGNILKVLFIIQTSATSFHVKLILNKLHLVIQQLSHMKLSYPLLEINLVLVYWMINILQSHISLIRYKIHHPVINFYHRLRKMCG